ncbi:hypothetical protein ACH5A7_20040 [Streptomyces sp. NPDC018955]
MTITEAGGPDVPVVRVGVPGAVSAAGDEAGTGPVPAPGRFARSVERNA